MPYVFPPIDFTVYGLSSSWSKLRWLMELDWQTGPEAPAAPGYEQVFGVWLGHGTTRRPRPDDPWVLIGSLPLQRYGRIRTSPGEDLVQALASAALWPLVGVVTPELSDDQRPVWSQHVMAFIEERASQYDTWLEVTWSLDGTSVPARVFQWAGAWSGLALTPEVAVIVVANSVKPEGLALAQVRAGDDYHFDVNAPFEWPGFIEVSQEEVFQGSDDFWDRRWPYHVDHQELLAPDDHQDPG